MNIFCKLFKKRSPCITEFSKWVVRAVIKIIFFIVGFSVVVIAAQTYIAFKSAINGNYSSVTIDLPPLIEFAKDALLVLLGYVCAAAFVNRKKIDKGYDPHYDDKFKPPDNGGEDET